MKRLSLLLVMIFMVCLSWAAIDEYYSFTATTGTYTPITGTSAGISSDDAISAAIPIGFTFGYGDFSFSEVKISTNGWVGLGTSQTGSNLTNNLASTSYQPVVAPLWDDLSMASGTVSYEMTGTAPNRIFTIQYTDAKWNYSGPVGFNFQVQLYETGKISIIYGASGGTPNNPSASIGINMGPGGSGWYYSIDPITGTASTTTETNNITTFPVQGTVYEFNPVVAQPNDLAATGISGNTTPSVGISATYTVTVRNRGSNPQTTYQVKLIDGSNNELGSVAGTAIQPAQTLSFQIPWTPAVAGPMSLIGKVVLTGDQNTTNDQTAPLPIAVQPAGIQAVTIADGTATMRIPMDFFWKNSLSETIYLSDELGFVSGTITSLALYNNFVDSPSNGATKIWLGSTNAQDLSGGWIPSTQMTLVFDGNITYPSGANTITIPLQTPYMHTPGNLVMMVQRPMDTDYYSSSDNFYGLTIGTNRTLKVQSDSTPYDPANPPAGTTPVGQVPKTTIFYTGQQIVNDLSCLTITGSGTPNVNSTATYTITVKNNGTATQTNYTVKLMKEGGVQLATAAGTSIASLETASFNLSWTPTTVETTYLYGVVELAGDEIATNNQTGNLTVQVMEAGLTVVQIGQGTATNSTTGAPTPYGTYWKNFRQQYLYTAADIYAAGGAPGLINALAFNVTSVNNCSAMPNYTIKVKHTDQTELTTTFEVGEYTTVWNSPSYLPTAGWNVHTFTTPFFWNGASNLLIDICTDIIPGTYTQNASVPYTPTAYPSCLRFQSDSSPASSATTGTTSTNRANARLFLTISDMGSLTGVVSSSGAPLEGASVTVVGTVFHTLSAADGSYNLPYVPVGTQQVMATKHGYNEVTHTVTIVEDQTTTQNFELTLLPQVTVTGRVVGSDQPTVGLAGATITLSGYEPYEATTNATGNFTIPNVFANQTYNYVVNATGYQQATGQVVVGTTNVNMGDITVNELAFPPYGVVAEEAANFSNVTVTWQAPNPAAVGEWLHYDNGENNDSIGTGGANDFDVYIRYPASALSDYAGMSLYTLKVWPAQAGTFSVRVWTGGTATQPANMVVDQGFTPVLDTYNTVELDNPVTVTGNEELWFGYRNVVTGGYPAGCDAGPAVDGFGNMMYFGGSWTTLIAQNPDLNYNWNIQGYVGFSAPSEAPALTVVDNSFLVKDAQGSRNNNRVLLGYRVYRLLAADQGNEANWTTLTTSNITPTTYVDNAWQPLPSGVYKFAVKAVYTNNVFSNAAFSNEIHKGMMGTLTGTVTEFGTSVPIQGATITAGEYSGQSDATGHYSFGVYAGTYTVTCVKPGYQPGSQAGVVITGLQTTTQNFVLTELTLPPVNVHATDNGAIANITWEAPGTATGITEGFEGTTFPPTDWSQIITNTGAAGTTGVYPTWCQVGTIALTPAVPPHGGSYQAAMWWAYSHQDEWLITPQFPCPSSAVLQFWSYVYLGSTNNDHYYIKISTDNGNTWTVLWDATAQTGGWNYYTTPISVDLNAYAGQQIKLAWHADDPPSADGMWYVWFVDDVVIGSPSKVITFSPEQLFAASQAPTAAPKIVYPTSPISREVVNNNNETQHNATVRSLPPTATVPTYNGNRVLVGYQVWRLLQGQETNESAWTILTSTPITNLTYADNGWASLPDGTYKWAVKAVYTGGAYSVATLSNPLPLYHEIGTIAGIVRNMQNQPISGATVTCGDVTATTNASGAYSMSILSGTHSVTASHPNYQSVTQTGIIVVTGQTTTVNFQLPPTADLFSDGFETYPDFTLTFAPWTLVDVDQIATYGVQGYTWENIYTAQAFIIFNPTATTPAMTSLVAHGGNKLAACFNATTPPNNDWMITPQFDEPNSIKFWARSYTSQYGLERFKVGVSSTTNPANFTIISGPTYVQAPEEWTEYTYQISQPGPLYIGINCVSNDAFFLCIDDVTVTGGDINDPEVPVVATALHNNYPNPFNPETTISYSVKETGPVTIDVYNVKGQLVKSLVKGIQEPGNHTIVWNGTDNNGRSVSSGVYYYKMNAGKYSSTRKMIMMK